ncbi:hypothetical protein L873DRAFT_1668256 [Choiromyces venosus 120613-1]|uniref:Uncharacterized protein n=1 Tax=Choiromyces venosus 120613-1 TaxID=1336337 RepID=A0A3N4JZU0_9PEZI|nr:hypothetical protein L873DRAFT_1668256 [Choiromyces venosus 120613-1]
MCDYTKVTYKCGHYRLLVKAWCNLYVSSQGTKRCLVNVATTEEKTLENCSSM